MSRPFAAQRDVQGVRICDSRWIDLAQSFWSEAIIRGQQRSTALVDVSAALSWRGVPYALRDRAARRLRRHPRFAAVLQRALDKPASREES